MIVDLNWARNWNVLVQNHYQMSFARWVVMKIKLPEVIICEIPTSLKKIFHSSRFYFLGLVSLYTAVVVVARSSQIQLLSDYNKSPSTCAFRDLGHAETPSSIERNNSRKYKVWFFVSVFFFAFPSAPKFTIPRMPINYYYHYTPV